MQGGIKKEYRMLGDKPVLVHAVLPFVESGFFKKIIITVPADDIQDVMDLLSRFISMERISVLAGGKSRQESVFKGLEAFNPFPPDSILIHDGARPWIRLPLIRDVLLNTQKYGSCIPVVEVPDALKEINTKGEIVRTLTREWVKGAQTPQGFDYRKLYAAHLLAREKKMSALDDAEVFSLIHNPVITIPGDAANRKITYSHDLQHASGN